MQIKIWTWSLIFGTDNENLQCCRSFLGFVHSTCTVSIIVSHTFLNFVKIIISFSYKSIGSWSHFYGNLTWSIKILCLMAVLRWIAFVVKVFFVVVGPLVALVFCIVKICLLSFLLLPIILKADVLLSHLTMVTYIYYVLVSICHAMIVVSIITTVWVMFLVS